MDLLAENRLRSILPTLCGNCPPRPISRLNDSELFGRMLFVILIFPINSFRVKKKHLRCENSSFRIEVIMELARTTTAEAADYLQIDPFGKSADDPPARKECAEKYSGPIRRERTIHLIVARTKTKIFRGNMMHCSDPKFETCMARQFQLARGDSKIPVLKRLLNTTYLPVPFYSFEYILLDTADSHRNKKPHRATPRPPITHQTAKKKNLVLRISKLLRNVYRNALNSFLIKPK